MISLNVVFSFFCSQTFFFTDGDDEEYQRKTGERERERGTEVNSLVTRAVSWPLRKPVICRDVEIRVACLWDCFRNDAEKGEKITNYVLSKVHCPTADRWQASTELLSVERPLTNVNRALGAAGRGPFLSSFLYLLANGPPKGAKGEGEGWTLCFLQVCS